MVEEYQGDIGGLIALSLYGPTAVRWEQWVYINQTAPAKSQIKVP